MTEYPWHQSLHLQNFTVFKDTKFEFVPGVNALVGENGTGKTHLMKAMYAAQLAAARQNGNHSRQFQELFQIANLRDLIRFQTPEDVWARVSGIYQGQEWLFEVLREKDLWSGSETLLAKAERPVFIPAIDMMGHTKAFLAAANEIELDFDLTCRDIVGLFTLKRNGRDRKSVTLEKIQQLLGGELHQNETTGRFFLTTPQGILPMPLVSEGLRKIATLARLAQNGWLTPGTTLFWDEPEANLNPILMDEVVGAILELARQGVQVFLATHSYVILKELDLQSKETDNIHYFGFERNANGVTVNPTDDFDLLTPDPILQQYNSLFDQEITRATGRKPKRERAR